MKNEGMKFIRTADGVECGDAWLFEELDHGFLDLCEASGISTAADLMNELWELDQDVYWDVIDVFRRTLVAGQEVLGWRKVADGGTLRDAVLDAAEAQGFDRDELDAHLIVASPKGVQ